MIRSLVKAEEEGLDEYCEDQASSVTVTTRGYTSRPSRRQL